MLVLCRDVNEAVIVNNNVRVVVVAVRGNRVRLGFEAAADIPIHREEIHELIERGRNPGVATD